MSDESLSWVENNRTSSETDEHWACRLGFLREYADRFEKNRLICLSKIYVNMKYLGCRYDKGLMRQVTQMSSAIGFDQGLYRSNAEKPKIFGAENGLLKSRAAGDIKRYVQFFSTLRVQLLQTDKNADSMQMLNQACGKQRADWVLKKNDDGFYVLSIEQCLVLRQKFDQETPTLRQIICNVAVHHLLNNARVDIQTVEGAPSGLPFSLVKDNIDPDHCFAETVRHCLGKTGISSITSKKDALSRLTEALGEMIEIERQRYNKLKTKQDLKDLKEMVVKGISEVHQELNKLKITKEENADVKEPQSQKKVRFVRQQKKPEPEPQPRKEQQKKAEPQPKKEQQKKAEPQPKEEQNAKDKNQAKKTNQKKKKGKK